VKITSLQIEAAYQLAAAVFDSEMTEKAASIELRDKYSLGINSAAIFIKQYRHMLLGEVFQRTISAPALEYFLCNILKDRGQESAQLAVASVWKHIEYHDGLSKGKQKSIRKIAERFQTNIFQPLDENSLQEKFDKDVQNSLKDSTSARQQRLQAANKIPVLVVTIKRAYLRNADVVAEVLRRAKGVCERCKKTAPFLRKSDGSPYLEVHHLRQLANGGEDTVENAIALCPNCHRELHCGNV
jgi:5-methylcytosine-specific restriction protein A